MKALKGKVALLLAAGACAMSVEAKSLAYDSIKSDGKWPYHCQGVATDGESIYWSFTTVLVKSDLRGKTVDTFRIDRGHMGDLCFHEGRLFVGVNNGSAPDGTRIGDEVWEFDAMTLNRLKVHPTPQTIWCNNGVEWYDGHFWVVCNASQDCVYNYVFQYTPDFRFKCCRRIASGWTEHGVQAILLAKGKMMFACYGGRDSAGFDSPCCVFSVDPKVLNSPYKSNERPPILPILSRVPVNACEGLLELDGSIWVVQPLTFKNADGTETCSGNLYRCGDL